MVIIHIHQFQPGAPWSTPLRWNSSSGNGRPIRSLVDTATTRDAFWIGKLRPGEPDRGWQLAQESWETSRALLHEDRRRARITSHTKPAFLGR
jgi:hypothetical protein